MIHPGLRALTRFRTTEVRIDHVRSGVDRGETIRMVHLATGCHAARMVPAGEDVEAAVQATLRQLWCQVEAVTRARPP